MKDILEHIPESKDAVYYESIHGRSVLYAGDSVLFERYQPLLTQLATYAEKISTDKKPTEGDCASMAGATVRALESLLERAGFSIYVIGTQSTGVPLSFYKKLGYGHHVINCIEGDDVAIAFDVTASYTYPSETKPTLFVVIDKNIQDVMTRLNSITASRWEIR